jgi:hypothetical protein
MATRNVTAPRSRSSSAPRPDSPDTWPVIWRVVAPGAGSYDRDMVFLETPIEADARSCCTSTRRQGLPTRLERVSVGPLPKGSEATLAELRGANAQTPGTKMRAIPAAWEARP